MRAATAMLANAAEVRDGLLYVLGGGIEHLWVGELPAQVAPTLVVTVELEPGELGRPFTPHLHVRSGSGDVVVDTDLPPAVPEPHVGDDRSSGTPRYPMVLEVPMHVRHQGTHRITVSVAGAELAHADFTIRLAGQPA